MIRGKSYFKTIVESWEFCGFVTHFFTYFVVLHLFKNNFYKKTRRNKSVFLRLVFKFRTDKAIYRLFESLHLKKYQNFKGDMTNEYSIIALIPLRSVTKGVRSFALLRHDLACFCASFRHQWNVFLLFH